MWRSVAVMAVALALVVIDGQNAVPHSNFIRGNLIDSNNDALEFGHFWDRTLTQSFSMEVPDHSSVGLTTKAGKHKAGKKTKLGKKSIKPGNHGIKIEKKNIKSGKKDTKPEKKSIKAGKKNTKPEKKNIKAGKKSIKPEKKNIKSGKKSRKSLFQKPSTFLVDSAIAELGANTWFLRTLATNLRFGEHFQRKAYRGRLVAMVNSYMTVKHNSEHHRDKMRQMDNAK